MRTARFITILLLSALAASGCLFKQKPVPVAKSGEGTSLLPLGDKAQMAALQGLTVKPQPHIRLLFPTPGQILEEEKFVVKYEIENYTVSKDVPPLQHVHVIVDGASYDADYSPDGSTTVELAPGTHNIVVFLAREFHLSLKNPGAFDMVTFHVKERDGRNVPQPCLPMLVYSRPKGQYSKSQGQADNIMLDFFLRNVTLSKKGYRVRVKVDDGKWRYLARWEPIILLTMPPVGKYSVTLELVDRFNNVVSGPFNSTTREIEIVE
jgi:hypothetical protein